MSRFQHLPLFQKCYSFAKEVYRLKLQLPKNLKHDLGSDLFKSALRNTKLVIVANGSENKEKALRELFLEVQVIWVWLRLLVDLEAIRQISPLFLKLIRFGDGLFKTWTGFRPLL
jgi:hypothetical protein